ncbi:Na+/H+ antiporter subunit D [Rossellomorea marisflavi]|uniref:Na+/H+ antiporter subunit D n=1 Tax=Rossellomorea marisflavi TaxID=189381 RepID=A0A5D4RT61_9BACI|nr:Na+/H+ antiporter subunit D [Rossellomorea marisflavi]TYS52924.1 Na+/H+ antiporter subunit D [Rossellomorea marisflavi]WJV19882.1 Na+/H+ antiporter subunit D [Rossellomorea marisflavi]
MINLLILPILIPLITATILMFFSKQVKTQRTIAAVSTIGTVIASVILVITISKEGIQTLNLGSWTAPFGITLVSDMLSALLVLTTSIITLLVTLYSFKSIGRDRERFYYYPVVQFLLVGVNGAFTTGDIFNLFVFFEVMLMSSYVLIVLGGTKVQLREGIKYILVNVISSALFVITVAYLYSVVGTLNMADISQKIASVEQPGILTAIAILFLIVFGLKGAIFPLYFWLPGSYYAPPTPILALFGALLTKVGVYSIIRTYTLFFYHDPGFTHEMLGILAILTIVVGCVGAIGFWDVKKIIIYNIVIAVGVILFGVSTMNGEAMEGSIYYLIHDMIIKAALFLLIGVMISITGTTDVRKMGGLIKEYPWLGWTFLVAAFSLAGIPPLSGFIGKLLILKGSFSSEFYVGAFVILASSLVVLYSVIKIFLNGIWGVPKEYTGISKSHARYLWATSAVLVLLSVFYGLGADAIRPLFSQAAEVLVDPQIYIDAVLKE